MVYLYIWYPTQLHHIVEDGLMPDLGHAAVEVVSDEGEPLCYASFWPEIESLVGQLTAAFKPRVERHPISYALECDPDNGYMQRPADLKIPFPGLREERIVRGWRLLQEVAYDFFHWNCSNVTKYLLIRAMCEEDIVRLRERLGCSESDLTEVRAEEDAELALRLRRLALTDFIKCIPDDLVQLANAYNG